MTVKIMVIISELASRGPTLQKILYEILKSFDFIKISQISCDLSDFNDFVKHLKLVISKEKLLQIILIRIMQCL